MQKKLNVFAKTFGPMSQHRAAIKGNKQNQFNKYTINILKSYRAPVPIRKMYRDCWQMLPIFLKQILKAKAKLKAAKAAKKKAAQ